MKKFIFTRFGIGVFDPRWYDFRLSIFESITFPSIINLKSEELYWVIFIDENIPVRAKEKLANLISTYKSKEKKILMKEVKFVFEVPGKMKSFIESKIDGEKEKFLLSRIDDDDAIRLDTIELVEEKCKENNNDAELALTFPVGYEFLVAERKILKCNRPFLTMNTYLYINQEKLTDALRIGHHRVKEWAQKNDLQIEELYTNGPMYLYSRHKQSDSNFLGIRKTILEDSNVKFITQRVYQDFNIDQVSFQKLRDNYNDFPSIGREKLWDRNKEQIQLAIEYYQKLDEIKKKMIENTKNVF
ncbi:glycosyltransferase [Ornithinibacillus bavariensis]|uniref:Rhamnosyl transferase n=1 Tax=Ornithinibacillus bavariensis TaxID=545502 RepID=A0A920C6T4_9BACI|nr:glycosyltransferase [Ornithinibacillus bavariensis]GIO26923.1 hypothetical protein J43TS3_15340 [Ornithinibacillus bavariensis]